MPHHPPFEASVLDRNQAASLRMPHNVLDQDQTALNQGG